MDGEDSIRHKWAPPVLGRIGNLRGSIPESDSDIFSVTQLSLPKLESLSLFTPLFTSEGIIQIQNTTGVDAMPGTPPEDYKLCGFFCIVLSVKAPDPAVILSPGTPCSLLASTSDEVGFSTESGVLLLPIVIPRNPTAEIDGEDAASRKEALPPSFRLNSSSRKKRRRGEARKNKLDAFLARRRRWKAEPGLGNWSVVHQVHVLVGHKCLKIDARVVWVLQKAGSGGGGGDGNEGVRAVVMVDVYLPIAVWSGWQFPKSRMAAAALFRHLSCNWEERNLLLAGDANSSKYGPGDGLMLTQSDCLVLGCEMHSVLSGSARKKLFELHEIFKSLPAIGKVDQLYSTKVKPAEDSLFSGIWDVSDDVLISVLAFLGPKDLVRVASTCRHLRLLAASIMPCMKLKLYPHQKAAVEWMLQRERNAELVPHPLYMDFSTEDGFHFYVNTVSGEISTGIAPTIIDFCGGMFCDEPGLGKTITALSLILKTQGTLADPPQGAEVTWCMHNVDQRCGYYELGSKNFTPDMFMSSWKRFMGHNGRRSHICHDEHSTEHSSMKSSNSSPSSKLARLTDSEATMQPADSSCTMPGIMPTTCVFRCTRSLSQVKRNLLDSFEVNSNNSNKEARKNISCRKHGSDNSFVLKVNSPPSCANGGKKPKTTESGYSEISETWVQCDSCRKWRKLPERGILGTTKGPWFCSMNSDLFHQSCSIPEESWDHRRPITYLLGFYTKGSPQGMEQNVSFFTNVLKEHCRLINSLTRKALNWLANLADEKLVAMETFGLRHPFLDASEETEDACSKIFKAFGLIRKVEKGTTRWYYPCNLENLAFDLAALRISLTRPLDSLRLYLSRATLIVVPSNLVDHWKTQIQKHVRPGQLCVYVWTDQKKPCAHNLAWDYDIVITTFNRLSAEWGPHKRSVLMQVHWLRVMLDEGHTLGSSLNFTNKLQMAVSLAASNRWVLTGTPTPNTPSSQVAHLQTMLRFLHEEAYGQNPKSWEAGILRPFEAEMEEGRLRLLQLLCRCMISARKEDLQTIPPCIKKVTTLDFTEEHARTYNELVVTVRRNILMADWNDPSHVESLLNPKQWKLRSNTIRNVRLSCCVAGHIKVTDAGQDIQETMDILVEQGLDPLSDEYAFIKYCLLYGGDCFRCKEWCRLPVITPCKHLLCLDCVALDSEKCSLPGCGNLYEMQSPEILTRPENPSPKWPVPKDLIELQPSYNQDDWHPDWQSTSSSKVAYLVNRLKALQEVNRHMGYCMDVDVDNNPPSNALLALHKRQWDKLIHQMASNGSHDKYLKVLPEKVIIFSQFLEHIHVIEQQLIGAGIKYAGMYSPMPSNNKMKSLMIFQHDVNCMALLMDGSAALGLDLSFVTHVFLMEPIWDRSMEEQVISRAHRMGATRPVHVETLAMRGTIEEQMLQFLQDADEYRNTLKQDICKNEFEGARCHRTLHDFAESNYLARLAFVRTKCQHILGDGYES